MGLQLRGQLRISTGFPFNPECLIEVREPFSGTNIMNEKLRIYKIEGFCLSITLYV